MQDARLALLERGGHSAVPNAKAWVRRTARNLAAKAYRERLLELGAWYELNGVVYEPLVDYRADKAASQRAYYARVGRPSRAGEFLTPEQRERRRSSWRRSKARAYAAKRAS